MKNKYTKIYYSKYENMAWVKYNETQMKELKSNKYVKNVTNKSIIFTLKCKLEVLKYSKKWLFYKDIFKKLWFSKIYSEFKNTRKKL